MQMSLKNVKWWCWAVLPCQGFKSPALISWAPRNTGQDDKEWRRREAVTQPGTQMATPWIQHSNPGLIRGKGHGVDWVFCPSRSQCTWQKSLTSKVWRDVLISEVILTWPEPREGLFPLTRLLANNDSGIWTLLSDHLFDYSTAQRQSNFNKNEC